MLFKFNYSCRTWTIESMKHKRTPSCMSFKRLHSKELLKGGKVHCSPSSQTLQTCLYLVSIKTSKSYPPRHLEGTRTITTIDFNHTTPLHKLGTIAWSQSIQVLCLKSSQSPLLSNTLEHKMFICNRSQYLSPLLGEAKDLQKAF